MWYVLRYDWWKLWAQQNGFDKKASDSTDPPVAMPPINNNTITVKTNPGASLGVLRDNLYRDQDYKLLPPRAWSALAKWYDCRLPLPRTIIDISNPASPPPEAAAKPVKKV